jgi:hypothetical protein
MAVLSEEDLTYNGYCKKRLHVRGERVIEVLFDIDAIRSLIRDDIAKMVSTPRKTIA